MDRPATNLTRAADTSEAIDLTRTMAPEVPGFRESIVQGLKAVSELPDLSTVVQRHRFHGSPNDRQVAAKWLASRLGSVPDVSRLLVTGGTQNILWMLLARLLPKGTLLATERLTYAAIGQLSMLSGVQVLGVDIDEEGMKADALEHVCRSHKVAAVYLNPTGHNPTTSTMSLERRLEIAEVARRHNLAVFEDDVHGFITKNAPPPIASIAPDITWYIMTVSKCLGIGLRTAYLVAPSADHLAELAKPIPSISAWFVPGISAALITHLIETGAADAIAQGISNEIGARQDIAQEILGPLELMHTNRSSLHAWIDLPSSWTIEDLVDAAAESGVALRHPKVFATPGTEIRGHLRLSMIAPVTHADLREGLSRVSTLLKSRM